MEYYTREIDVYYLNIVCYLNVNYWLCYCFDYFSGEAIKKMLQEKKISSKINYDVLKSLNVSVDNEDKNTTAEPAIPSKPDESPPTPSSQLYV